jgi:hypothetical protein
MVLKNVDSEFETACYLLAGTQRGIASAFIDVSDDRISERLGGWTASDRMRRIARIQEGVNQLCEEAGSSNAASK